MPRPLIYDNGGKGRVYGLELVARHEFANNFTGWLAYTLSRAARTDSGETEDRLFDFDQTHILTAGRQLPAAAQLAGGRPLPPGQRQPDAPRSIGAVYNASTDRYDPIYGGGQHRPQRRLPPAGPARRQALDLPELDAERSTSTSRTSTTAPTPKALQYNFNFRESKPQQGLPILTILGIRAEF